MSLVSGALSPVIISALSLFAQLVSCPSLSAFPTSLFALSITHLVDSHQDRSRTVITVRTWYPAARFASVSAVSTRDRAAFSWRACPRRRIRMRMTRAALTNHCARESPTTVPSQPAAAEPSAVSVAVSRCAA